MKTTAQIKGFKGFNADMTCHGHKFEAGKTYTHKGEIKLCESGFHFCENPLDVLRYYSPTDSNFAEVKADKVSGEKSNDTKRVSSEIKIGAKITLSALIQAGVSFLISACKSKKATSGDYSPSATSGNCSHSATSGDCSHSATSGDWSHSATSGNSSPSATSGNYSPSATSGYCSPSATSGENSIACAIGRNSKAKSTLGNWLVLSEIDDNYNVLCVKTVKVDGKKIKADTWYKLEGGKFVIAE